MKSQTLPTKRRPVANGMFRKLSAVTQARRKQRVAAAGTVGDLDEGHSKIARALVIIVLIHLLAVALIFVHHRFLSGRPAEQAALPESRVSNASVAVQQPASSQGGPIVHSQLSPGETPYIVRSGDNYTSIAKAHDVAERDLRDLNGQIDLRSGYILKIPVKRVVVKPVQPVSVAAVAPVPTPVKVVEPPAVPARDRGLVEAVDTRNAPRAQPVNATTPEASPGSYVVQQGDSIWRIATRFGVDQKQLMDANGISDPRKLRSGMELKIP